MNLKANNEPLPVHVRQGAEDILKNPELIVTLQCYTLCMRNNHVAYRGPAFTIEWYHSEKGESQALNYYRELDDGDRRKVLLLFKIMGDTGKIHDE